MQYKAGRLPSARTRQRIQEWNHAADAPINVSLINQTVTVSMYIIAFFPVYFELGPVRALQVKYGAVAWEQHRGTLV